MEKSLFALSAAVLVNGTLNGEKIAEELIADDGLLSGNVTIRAIIDAKEQARIQAKAEHMYRRIIAEGVNGEYARGRRR